MLVRVGNQESTNHKKDWDSGEKTQTRLDDSWEESGYLHGGNRVPDGHLQGREKPNEVKVIDSPVDARLRSVELVHSDITRAPAVMNSFDEDTGSPLRAPRFTRVRPPPDRCLKCIPMRFCPNHIRVCNVSSGTGRIPRMSEEGSNLATLRAVNP